MHTPRNNLTMNDLIFPKEKEQPFLLIAKKLGTELFFIQEQGPCVENTVGIYPQVTRAPILFARAGENVRTQIEQWPIDGLLGLEQLPAINHVILSLMHKKQILAFFLLRPLFGVQAVALWERMQILVPLLRKYRVSLGLATGAQTPYEMRSIHDLQAWGVLLGMSPKEVQVAFSFLKERKQYNEKKRKGEIIKPGLFIQQ